VSYKSQREKVMYQLLQQKWETVKIMAYVLFEILHKYRFIFFFIFFPITVHVRIASL